MIENNVSGGGKQSGKVFQLLNSVNDPNLWSDNPRYILNLVSRVIQISVETQKIVSGLPMMDFSSQKS
ncbi:MAG: hypothetical protein ACI4QT_10790 [Kiritimatiellia bacterium]